MAQGDRGERGGEATRKRSVRAFNVRRQERQRGKDRKRTQHHSDMQ